MKIRLLKDYQYKDNNIIAVIPKGTIIEQKNNQFKIKIDYRTYHIKNSIVRNNLDYFEIIDEKNCEKCVEWNNEGQCNLLHDLAISHCVNNDYMYFTARTCDNCREQGIRCFIKDIIQGERCSSWQPIPKPEYRPWTFEDREIYQDVWIKNKPKTFESCISTINQDGIFINGVLNSFEHILESYTLMDGRPCGRKL